MSVDEIRKEITKFEDAYNSHNEVVEILEAKQKSQIEQIKSSLHRFLDKTSGSLREKIATLFREQGVTIFSVLTAIGMTIGMLVEALLPGGAMATGGSSSTPSGSSTKEWIKKKLETLKNLLKKLANKFGAALPEYLVQLYCGYSTHYQK